MARPTGRDIRQAAVDEATEAMKAAGISGFSYADVARELGVKAPSIHHHFPRKHELVAAAVIRYRERFRERVSAIDATPPLERLSIYCELFLEPAADNVLCLCGAAIASWDELDPASQTEVRAFFDEQIHWVAATLTEARNDGQLRDAIEPASVAATLVAALEGALLLARTAAGERPDARIVDTLLLLVRPD